MDESIAKVPTNPLAGIGGQSRQIVTSLDLTKQPARIVMLRCMGDCDYRLTNEVNKPLLICDYVIHEVTIRGEEDGEIVHAYRMVLIDKDGKTYECVSETLLRSLQNVAFAFGPPPWVKGLKLTVKSKRKGERNIYYFSID